MKRILSAISDFFNKLFKREKVEEQEEFEELDISYPNYNVKKLLESIYDNPEELEKLPYEYLYSERAEYYNQLFYVLDNRWNQIQIDLLLGFITKEDYDKRVEEYDKVFNFYKNQCLVELEVL